MVSLRRDKFALSFNKQTDANTVGDYHTHGDYSRVDKDGNIVRTGPLSDANGGLNSDKFSSSDIIGTNEVSVFLDNPNYTAYLGTPGGNILSYSPAGGVSVLK